MNSPQAIIVGITGGIACGKTETGRILSAEGFKVLDSDFLAHGLMEKGCPVYEKTVAHFGRMILGDDGTIDRSKLGKIVFSDPQELAVLNRLVHPAVMQAARQWIEACREAQEDGAVLVPLLFETGWTEGWDAVVCVTAPQEQVFRRLEQRGLKRDDALKRIVSQMSLTEKAALADFVIENDGTLDALYSRITDIISKIRNGKRKSYE